MPCPLRSFFYHDLVFTQPKAPTAGDMASSQSDVSLARLIPSPTEAVVEPQVVSVSPAKYTSTTHLDAFAGIRPR